VSPKKYFSRDAGNKVHLSSHHETADSQPVPVDLTNTYFIHTMLTTKYRSNIPTKEPHFCRSYLHSASIKIVAVLRDSATIISIAVTNILSDRIYINTQFTAWKLQNFYR
jgi:hypothetical protein